MIIINGYACDTDVEAFEQLRRLVWRLTPDWRNPERFHENKSEINGALTKLIKLAARRPTQPRALPSPSPSNPRVWPPESPIQPVNGQALAKAEALFKPAVASFPRPRAAKGNKGKAEPSVQSAWRPRRHRYPRPPRGLNTQGKLL